MDRAEIPGRAAQPPHQPPAHPAHQSQAQPQAQHLGTAAPPPQPPPHPLLGSDRAEDLLALARLSARPQPVRALLDWLARRTGVAVALIGPDGVVRAVAPEAYQLPPAAVPAVLELHRRGAASGVVGGPGGPGAQPVHVVGLGQSGPGPGGCQAPYLAVPVAPDASGAQQHGTLLADAARTLGLCWRLEEAERARQRLESAEAHSREAVLHLLMSGSVTVAHRIAAMLPPDLPDPARVYVLECPAGRRREVADHLHRASDGQAWIVPCPVRPNHLIALVPPADDLDKRIAERIPECRVGVGGETALRDTATGYEQAFHGLAVARPACRFAPAAGPVPPLPPEALPWARGLLTPCLDHSPSRRADPGGTELLATLGSWLSFGGSAHRHLKIHRNTLAARVRLLESLLGLRLSTSLPDQAAAWLALRLHAQGGSKPTVIGSGSDPDPVGPAGLDELLAGPGPVTWAEERLRLLREQDTSGLYGTVRAWLRADARLPATATALGMSVPGVRKRLTRVEEVLGRSLLRAPSAKYELWLAMSALSTL